jgi:EAL domain-containing protein (putative c-di-GMP-specific phosphodiesterase class I)
MGLRHALERDELFLAYQPVFDLADMRVIAMEALIRWSHPGRGIVPPNDFIPLAEETGLIPAIGAWVLRRACSQGAAWRRAGREMQMAVNVSARQLDGDQLLADVNAALQESGLSPQGLILEVTETALMRNVDETVHRLRAIKELGPRIAIDDFGTGYSSLAHLQRFPVDALKIDRSFVSRLGESTEADAFIRTLVQLGKTLSLETVAEGIERDEELAKLRDEGCESGQGFLFARPLDVADAEALLLRATPVATTTVVRPRDPRRAADSRAA